MHANLGAFFLAHFLTFSRSRSHDCINDFIFIKFFLEKKLLFFEVHVAKEYRILRKWTKKMSKIKNAKRLL